MLKWSILIFFFVGLASPINFRLGGDIFLPDMFFTGSFLFLGRRLSKLPGQKYILTLIILGALWFLGQVVTDFYRETPIADWTRGWAKILFFLMDFLGLLVASRFRLNRILAFAAGSSIGMVLQTLFFPNSFQEDNGADFAGGPWKFGLGPGLTYTAAAFGATPLSARIFGLYGEAAPLAIMGVLNLAMNSRSAFGMAMAGVAFGAFKRYLDKFPRLRVAFNPGTFAALGLGGMVFARGLIAVYATAAENDWLGDAAKEKYEAQTSGDLSLLQAGRLESLVSTQAIADLPLLGHGSWARDLRYTVLLRNILESKGFEIKGEIESGDDLIPTHSHLLGAWVEAGVLGGVFWAAVCVIAVMAIYRTLKQPGVPATYLGFIFFNLIWDVWFRLSRIRNVS